MDAAGAGNGVTIGRLARAAGVHVETVRYYQQRGLLPVPPQPRGAYRRYPLDWVGRLKFIKRAQALGMSLEEVGRMLANEATSTPVLSDAPAAPAATLHFDH